MICVDLVFMHYSKQKWPSRLLDLKGHKDLLVNIFEQKDWLHKTSGFPLLPSRC